jgi:CrcB protein
MRSIICVGVGSFIGGVLRYLVSAWMLKMLDPAFPFGTLAVNVLGCLLMGFLAGLAEARLPFSADARLFFIVGIVGGFTTFSAFAWETFALARSTQWTAGLNIALQLLLGLLAVWFGHLVGLSTSNVLLTVSVDGR